MSDSETAWANRCEWEADSGGMEICRTIKNKWPENCHESGCKNRAVTIFEIGRIDGGNGGAEIFVCKEHEDDEIVWGIYERRF